MKDRDTQSRRAYTKPQLNRVLIDYRSGWQKIIESLFLRSHLVDDSESTTCQPTQEDHKISTIMKTLNFETKLFKGLVIPGVIAEVVMILVIPILMYASLGYIGGPKGAAVGMTLLPIQMLFYSFLAIAAVYAFVLIRMRKRQSAKFVRTAREFLLCGDIAISVIMLFSIYLTIVGWGYFYEPSVIAILALGGAALAYFII